MALLDEKGFSKPTDWDHRCWVWVILFLSAIYSLSFFGARIFGKYGLLWFDDAVLGGAYLLAIVHWGLLSKALSIGLGTSLVSIGWSSREGNVSSLLFGSRLLWLAALYATKASLLVFNRKIFSGTMGRDRLSFFVTGAVIALCFVASMITSSAGCNSKLLLNGDPGSSCSAETARLAIVCVFDMVSEVALFAMPVLLLVPIHMQKDKKRVVILLYACPFFIGQTANYAVFAQDGPTSLGSAPTLVLQEITLCVSFITCTIPCLRSFFSAFNSGGTYGAATVAGSYAMRSMNPTRSQQRRTHYSRAEPDKMPMRLDPVQHDAEITHGNDRGDNASMASDGSEQMIIRRETRVAVHYAQREDGV